MKNKIILFTILLALLTGCDDILDKTPYTSVPDFEMFSDIEGAQGALNGIYNSMTSYDYYGRLIYAYEGCKGPDFFVEDTGNRFQLENGYRETSVSGGYASAAWDQIYSTIFLCNNLLANVTLIEGNQDEAMRIKGETLAIRGLAYFDLLRLFAYPPIYSCPGGAQYNDKYKMGVPLILSQEEAINALTEPPVRTDAETCYDQVVTDFKDAATNLANSSAADGRVSLQAVNALLARVYLYLGNWSGVITAAEAATSGGSMLDYDDYKTNYFKAYNSENIWELDYSLADNLGSNSLNHLTRNPTIDIPGDPNDGKIADDAIGYAGYGANVYIREVLRAIPEDVRTYLICDNELGPETGIRKYIGDGGHSIHNITIVRLPEVYLTLAEAYAEQGSDLTKAADYLNMVYEKRTNITYTGTTKEQIIQDVLLERRKELVLEGHTYWDHFRRAIPFDREAEGNVGSEVAHIDFTLPQVVYPIPQNEMESNPNIRGQQNPGYAAYSAN
uniref:RagB/SusD family nutrient uptake outer membrane protein n=1 Tax=uncultured Draconibacterium sp. TaxID=1573823 RepID=UPI003217AA23